MFNFIETLKNRNETLFYFGLLCLSFSIICLVMTKISETQVYGVNAWYKPFKFAFSTFLYVWSMAWYLSYLPNFNTQFFNWSTIVLLSFEIIYIAFKAGLGQTSHFNISTPTNALMFSLMGIAATLVTLFTAYIGVLFFTNNVSVLPNYYLWSIRISLFLFVVFAFEGFFMGAKLSHSVGAINDNSSLYILGWSQKHGDLRIAHFIGMHALQLLPILAFYVLKNNKWVFLAGILYFILAIYTLTLALKGKPLLSTSKSMNSQSKM